MTTSTDAPNEPGADAGGRRYHRGNLREELIRIGKLHLQTEAPGDLSLRRISADAGVSQVAPKHHFGNKEGLLAAIAASGFRDLTEFRYSKLRPGMEAGQRLRVVLTAYVQFATANPSLFNLMFSPQLSIDAHAELIDAASQSYQLLLRATGEFLRERRADTSATLIDDGARHGWICMHGLATLLIERRINPLGAPHYSRDQLMVRTVDQVFNALDAAPVGRAPP